jgi:TRAP-type C4-dicarboxylate transport system substrate-binding protein
LFSGLLISSGFAKSVKIKLGTFAPKETFWVKDLQQMGASWKTLSNNKVRLKIYAGGVAGDEPSMAAKLRTGQLTAATLTVLGLQDFVPEILVFSTPFLFKSDEEVRYVMDRMMPEFEKRFEARGFKVLHWSTLGWTYLFSKEKVLAPEDLSRLKLFVDSPEGSEIYGKVGFKSEQLSRLDLLRALSTSMVSAYVSPPLYSLINQWFGLAGNMMDLPISPALAATIMSKKTWDKIDSKHHREFLDIAKEIGRNAEIQVGKFDKEAKVKMVENKLTIHPVTPQQEQIWRNEFAQAYAVIEKKVSKDIFQEVTRILLEYRTGKQ